MILGDRKPLLAVADLIKRMTGADIDRRLILSGKCHPDRFIVKAEATVAFKLDFRRRLRIEQQLAGQTGQAHLSLNLARNKIVVECEAIQIDAEISRAANRLFKES